MIVIPLVVLPAARRANASDLAVAIVRRFQRLSRELLLVIVLTGIFNLINVGLPVRFSFPEPYLWIVGGKVALLALMAGNQAWFSYSLVPQARPNAAVSALVNVGLAAVVIFLGLRLRGL